MAIGAFLRKISGKNMVSAILFLSIFLIYSENEAGVYLPASPGQNGAAKSQMTENESSACPVIPPKDASVIIRIDDVQAFAWNLIVQNLTDAANARNMPVVLAVIPRYLGQDPVMKGYLRDRLGKNSIEVALHGTNHTIDEYENLNEKDAQMLANAGLETIRGVLDTVPVTFIPPNTEYNENAAEAVSKLGFRVISAGKDEYNFSHNIFRIGYTIPAKAHGKMTHASEVIFGCSKALEQKKLCVILVHPQDYATSDMISLNMTSYAEFQMILDGIKKTGAKVTTFRDLLACQNQSQAGNKKRRI